MKQRILYVMHISWRWAKQRPHFLAEELSKDYDVIVLYRSSYRRRRLSGNLGGSTISHRLPYFSLPFLNRSMKFQEIDSIFISLQLFLVKYIYRPSIVWLTSPSVYPYIKRLRFANVVYDCMDDFLEFPKIRNVESRRDYFAKQERELCARAMLTIFSSNYLSNKVTCRYGLERQKTVVVNNGIASPTTDIEEGLPGSILSLFEPNGRGKIVYIGTISEWFNFDLIISSLNSVKDIDYILFGPAEVMIPEVSHLAYYGPVAHEYVSAIMNMSDVMIMPFIVNELVRSVDPVKVYEYISSGKPSLIPEYGETLKFKQFVHLYSSSEEYIKKLTEILNGQLALDVAESDRTRFLQEARWSNKRKVIVQEIRKRLKELEQT